MRKDKTMLQIDKLANHLAFVLRSMDDIAGVEDITITSQYGLSYRFEHVILTTATIIRDLKLTLK